MIKLNGKTYKNLKHGLSDAEVKEWIKNWREKRFWTKLFDFPSSCIERKLQEYCVKNKIEYDLQDNALSWHEGCMLRVISDRRQYNDIMRIINEDEEDQA